VHTKIILEVKGIELDSDRISYVKVRGRPCSLIVSSVHHAADEKLEM
jgi:hypothetical protein